MKSRVKKAKGIVKGAPSGFIISLLVHAAAFALAGLLVVFTVTQKKEKQFSPPAPVERPKMKLKKPKVKVKKNAKPKSASRIVTNVKRADMPDIHLPEMSGVGDGFAGGVGAGFSIEMNLDELSVLGSGQSIGNDFKGTFYDIKFTRSGKFAPTTTDEWGDLYYKFLKNDWNPRVFSKYYRSPTKLYTTCFVLPPSISAMAPVAFGMDDSMASGGHWFVHYEGKLVHKEDITFRFWVAVDDSLAIRVDDEIVLGASFISHHGNAAGLRDREQLMYRGLWSSPSLDTAKYLVGHSLITVGDWITLEAGVPKDMELIAGDNQYANASFVVMVEVEGVEYPKADHNGPLLPIFKTAELSHDLLDIIYQGLADGEADCENGPIFRDY